MNNHTVAPPSLIFAAITVAVTVVLCTGILASGALPNQPAFGADTLVQTATSDLADWFKEDLTPLAQLRNTKKEYVAALKIALDSCKELGKQEQPACIREARRIYEQDLANARQRTGVHQ